MKLASYVALIIVCSHSLLAGSLPVFTQVDIIGLNGLTWGMDLSSLPLENPYSYTKKSTPVLTIYSFENNEFMDIPATISYGFTTNRHFNWGRVTISRFESDREHGLDILSKLLGKYGAPTRYVAGSVERSILRNALDYVEEWRPSSRPGMPIINEIVWKDKDGDFIRVRMEDEINIEYYSAAYDQRSRQSGF